MQLAEYFRPGALTRALHSYGVIAQERSWSVGHKLDLYLLCRRAFSDAGDEAELLSAFSHVHASLAKYWQVFRPRGPGSQGSPQALFAILRASAPTFGMRSGTRLRTLRPEQRVEVWSFFLALREIKANKGFPTMAASKFAHFFNPDLFPIYDTEVVWNQVFARFQPEFDAFCRDQGHAGNVEGAQWLANYVSWAAHLIQGLDASARDEFADWMKGQAPGHAALDNGSSIAHELDACLFEFAAIGAAAIEARLAR